MAPITEVVLITLVPDADYTAITESVAILSRQPGCLAVRASRLREEVSKVHYFIDWDSVSSHYAFARNKEVYAPFRALVGSVMEAYAPPYHVPLGPYPLDVFDAGVVMVGKAWFPVEREDVEAAFEESAKLLREKGGDGFTGHVAQGWSLEEGIVFKGEQSRVFLFVVGWTSSEAYLKFRGSKVFGEVFSGVTGLETLRELEICSVDIKA
ncbi:hypothetical protein F5Y03DRAFT_195179 [Xylaria venustula]|nr:hypothetical protein F5Y03DRAFT_195179 [Xylaria venustula]